LENAETLEQLRSLNRQLIEENLELKKQLVELNAKLDKILSKLETEEEINKIEIPASTTLGKLQSGRTLILRNIFFDYNRSSLRSRSRHELRKLFEFMDENPSVNIEVSGHTDSKGDDDYNMRLSRERAQAVVDYLVRNGISSKRLSAVGYGETRPIARNENADGSDNAVGRQLNRRIEISIPQGEVEGVEIEPVQVPAGARIQN
jgi:outer membrane protein OmpA-like peptidoglycan-associated protein